MASTEQQLHDRATRGEALSATDRTNLDAWYAQLDREKMAANAMARPPANLATLQAQIDGALVQLATVTGRVQTLAAENAIVRQEISSLKLLLAQKTNPQPA